LLCNHTYKAYIVLDIYRGGILNIFKHFIAQLTIVLVLCIISSIGIFTENKQKTNTKIVLNKKTVIIDAGHGGFDGGAVAEDGTVEKDINLNIALKLSKLLKFNGYNVVLTRNFDTGTEEDKDASIAQRKKSDLKNRLKLMEKYPDSVFLSIHLNKFTTSAASGAQVFYSKNNDESSKLGQFIQDSVVKMLQPENTRVIKQGNSSTYLLHNAKIPAIIIECGFLSNHRELEILKNNDYQSKMAFAIFSGLDTYFQKNSDVI